MATRFFRDAASCGRALSPPFGGAKTEQPGRERGGYLEAERAQPELVGAVEVCGLPGRSRYFDSFQSHWPRHGHTLLATKLASTSKAPRFGKHRHAARMAAFAARRAVGEPLECEMSGL